MNFTLPLLINVKTEVTPEDKLIGQNYDEFSVRIDDIKVPALGIVAYKGTYFHNMILEHFSDQIEEKAIEEFIECSTK